jgi:MOSC domain-containing protein YiiM
MGKIYSISISAGRGELKKEVEEANILEGWGIEGDGHGGDWDRQITCLNYQSVLESNEKNCLNMGPGDFAENILITDLDFSEIKAGSRIKLGDKVILQVSQIGKEDHPSVVTRNFGVSLLPYEGLFCKVINAGKIKKGDNAEKI